MDFVSFVQNHRVDHSENKYNFLKLTGGKFEIRDGTTFISLLASAKRDLPLVFRGPQDSPTPFYLDVDILQRSATAIPTQVFAKMTAIFLHHIEKATGEVCGDVIITRRPCAYFNFRKKLFVNGFHVLLPSLIVTPKIMLAFRESVLLDGSWFDLLEPYDVDAVPAKIIDVAITTKRNGLVVISMNKPRVANNGPCRAHYICFTGVWRGGVWVDECLRLPGWHIKDRAGYTKYLTMAYSWVFSHDYTNTTKKAVPIPLFLEPAPTSPNTPKRCEKPPQSCCFNLVYFLKITKGWVPTDKEYRQVCMYLAGIKFDEKIACSLCNAAWCYKTRETQKFVGNYRNARTLVNKASIYRLARLHHCCNWDVNKLFPKPSTTNFRQFNDIVEHMPIGQWTFEEIEAVFSNVFFQSWGNNDARFFYRETSKETVGDNELKIQRWIISQGNPFEKFDRTITTAVTVKKRDILNFLDKLKPPKNFDAAGMRDFFNEIAQLKSAPFNLLIEGAAQRGMKTVTISRKQLSSLFNQVNLDDRLLKFLTFRSEPYLYVDKTPSDCLNIWQPNPLLMYKPKHKVDLKKTRTWYWFHSLLCNNDSYKEEWLTQWHHEKLCNGARKIEKILLFYSTETGSGKSSHNPWFSALSGAHTTLKVDDISEILKEKNAELLNRLVIYYDDAQRLKKQESEKLKSKTTEQFYVYRRLYENGVKMKALHDYIVTTNKRGCLYVAPEDRRVEIIDVNDEMALDKSGNVFWTEFYEELQNLDILKAWLDHFIQFKSTLNVRSKFCRFSLENIEIEQSNCMKVSHRFLCDMFSSPDFYESCCDPRQKGDEQYRLKYFNNFTLSDRMFTVENKFLWKMFTTWKRVGGEQSFLKRRTFVEQLNDIGISKQRLRFRGGRSYCFQLNTTIIREALSKKYKLLDLVDAVFKIQVKPSNAIDGISNKFEEIARDNQQRQEAVYRVERCEWKVY